MIRFAENVKVLPILASNDIAATATPSQFVDLRNAHWATLLVNFGDITNVSATLTLEASTAGTSNATEVAIPFRYRLTAAVGTDSMGAITSAPATGLVLGTADDNRTVFVDIDPASIAALGADYRFVRAVVTPNAANTETNVGIVAVLETRYPGNAIASAT